MAVPMDLWLREGVRRLPHRISYRFIYRRPWGAQCWELNVTGVLGILVLNVDHPGSPTLEIRQFAPPATPLPGFYELFPDGTRIKFGRISPPPQAFDAFWESIFTHLSF